MKHLLALFLLVSPVIGQEDLKRDLAKIAAIPNDIERLAAFDTFAVKLGIAPTSQHEESGTGKWRLEVDTSPIDDSQTITGILLAEARISTGLTEKQPVLIFRYKEGKVAAYVVFGTYLGSDMIEATVRLGKEPAAFRSFSISTDGMAAFAGGDVMSFMKEVAAADSFLIRLTPFHENPVTTLFSPKGGEKVIDAIQKAIAQKKG